MRDKKGYLPAHVACSRHCSPEKLRMLLAVNPGSLYERTNDGRTLLDLAKAKATKSHPNYALVDELNRQIQHCPVLLTPAAVVSEESDAASRDRLDSNDSDKTLSKKRPYLEQQQQQQQQGASLDPVDLLLHFSRTGSSRKAAAVAPLSSAQEQALEHSGQYAEV